MALFGLIESAGYIPFDVGGTSATDPQMLIFENFKLAKGTEYSEYSHGTLSVHGVNIPLSLSLANVVFLMSASSSQARTLTLQWGLYSLNGSTLSLANSASQSINFTSAISWVTLVTSAAQNISPGNWWFAANALSAGNSSYSFRAATSLAIANAAPYARAGRMTVSTNAMPASIATSDLDITGADANRQPLIIITA